MLSKYSDTIRAIHALYENARSGSTFMRLVLLSARHQMIFQKHLSPKLLILPSLISLIVILSFMPFSTFAAQGKQEPKEIKIAYPPSLASITLMTGIKQKIFEQEGLRPVPLIITSDLALKSQTIGEIDYTLFGGGSGVLAAAQGLPIKIVHFAFKYADYTLVARPEFKTVAQLRGKKIAVSGFSGSIYSSTRAMLTNGGLDPDKDVVILPVGRENVRLQALFSGTIDATTLPAPLQALAEEKGFSLVSDIEGKFEIPLSGLTVTEKKLKENPDEVKRVVRAFVKSGWFYINHRAESVALFMDWLKLPKPIAERAYTRSLRSISHDGLGKETAFKNQLEIVKGITKKEMKQEDIVDFTILKSVLAETK
jgi:NitT/TauT family transport system substrate-binding protein